MMTATFKKMTTALMLISALGLSTAIFAEEVALPVISKPAILQEGTQRDLTATQIAELLPWAKNSKIFLTDLLENIQSLPSRDKNERLIDGIKSTVSESAPKNSELLMRYALNRGLVISETLSKEMSADEVGSSDIQTRVLIASVNMAIKFYDMDLVTMTKNTQPSFAAFGIQYYNFLIELNKSVIDASAQYAIQKTALEWLQWDLYRDLSNTSYAPQIVKINNALKIFPTKKMTDAQSLNYIRQMKKLSGQLNLYVKSGAISAGLGNAIKEAFEVGDRVFYSYDMRSGTVAGVRNGSYTIKFDDNSYSSDILRKYLIQMFGCDATYCVDEDVFYTYSNVKAKVEGIGSSSVVLRLESGEVTVTNFKNVAQRSGCFAKFCVGDKIVYTYRNTPGFIFGYTAEGLYVIENEGQYETASAQYLIKNGL